MEIGDANVMKVTMHFGHKEAEKVTLSHSLE